MLANDLRNGIRHSAKGAVEFAERCLEITERAGVVPEKILVRMESGRDGREFISALLKRNVKFLVKRNPHRECPEPCLDMARRLGRKQKTSDGKKWIPAFFHEFRIKFPTHGIRPEPLAKFVVLKRFGEIRLYN